MIVKQIKSNKIKYSCNPKTKSKKAFCKTAILSALQIRLKLHLKTE